MPHAGRALAGARDFPIGPLLTLDEESAGRRAVVSASGEVDLSNAADLREAIENGATGAFEVWLDLSDLTFIDSSGLHAMAEARLRLLQARKRLTLICPAPPILRILAVSGFDRVFEIHASRNAADQASPPGPTSSAASTC